MSVNVEVATGYRATERCAVWRHRLHTDTTRAIPVVFSHGILGGALTGSDPAFDDTLRWLCHAGHVCLSADLNGSAHWGNPGHLQAIDQLLAWAAAEYGTRTDKVGFVCQSMGGTSLTWMRQNPGKVAGAILHLPVTQLAAFRARNPLGLGGSMDGAYGGGPAFTAAMPVHDPMANAAAFVPLADRVRIWYSTDDTVVIPAEPVGFAAATGIVATAIGAQGHGLGTWDQRDATRWLTPLLARWA